MFTKKTERLRFLTGVGYATGEAYNLGDVAEIPLELARAAIAQGIAEATDAPIGTAPTRYELVECPRCGTSNSEWSPGCEHCGRRLR